MVDLINNPESSTIENSLSQTRASLLSFLDSLEIEYQTIEHPPVFTTADAEKIHNPIPGAHIDTKNLFLKDDCQCYWLISALKETQIDLRVLSKQLPAKNLRFAKPELLRQYLNVEPGSVTWFALFNDKGNRVKAILDKALFKHPLVGFHPLVNTATTVVQPTDLIRFAQALNHEYLLYDFSKCIYAQDGQSYKSTNVIPIS
jgi:Ala-tRNA(Pro) deacylase